MDKTAINDEKVHALLDELEALLDGGNVESLDLIDRTSGLNLRTLGSAAESAEQSVDNLINQLIYQIEYYEFTSAMDTLAQIKKESGRTGDD